MDHCVGWWLLLRTKDAGDGLEIVVARTCANGTGGHAPANEQ